MFTFNLHLPKHFAKFYFRGKKIHFQSYRQSTFRLYSLLIYIQMCVDTCYGQQSFSSDVTYMCVCVCLYIEGKIYF